MPENARFRLTPMRPRDPDERGRVASPLELFFDLVFVVGVSASAQQLHHSLAEGHVGSGIISYLVVFFGIWWAWMNFTWFATSFATEDWLYRVLTIGQMGGVLVLAAGVGPAFHGDFRVVVLGYVVMRIAMIAQWLRASRAGGATRRTAQLYAGGIAVVQVLWLASLLLPTSVHLGGIVVLIGAEVSIPLIAERAALTPWHPHHITERYSLFTLIVLGESLLASANAIIAALDVHAPLGELLPVAALVLNATAALWWIYFWPPHHRAISSFASSLFYGYGHFALFAAAGAVSAGIELELDAITGHGAARASTAQFAYSIPLAVFMVGVWLLAIRRSADRLVNIVLPVGAVLVLVDPLIPVPFAVSTLVLIGVVVVLVVRRPLEADAPHA